MTVRFSGKYTENNYRDVASGTVSVTPANGTAQTATLDGTGSYILDVETGGATTCALVETISGLVQKSVVSLLGGPVDTTRDIGSVAVSTQSGSNGLKYGGYCYFNFGPAYPSSAASGVIVDAAGLLQPLVLDQHQVHLAAGDYINVYAGAGDADPGFDASNGGVFLVENTAGTQRLVLPIPAFVVAPGGFAEVTTSAVDAAGTIGTDLTKNGNQIKSTAGGLFVAQLLLNSTMP